MSVLGWSPSLVRVSRERDAALAPAEAGSPPLGPRRWVPPLGGLHWWVVFKATSVLTSEA